MPGRHLEGKVAVVTGGAGGMGSWICKIFAEQGAKVVVADTGADVEGRMGMDPSRVNAVVDEIKAKGGEAVAITGDISEMDTAEATIRTAIETFRRPSATAASSSRRVIDGLRARAARYTSTPPRVLNQPVLATS